MGDKYDACYLCVYNYQDNNKIPCINCAYQLPSSFVKMYYVKEMFDELLDDDTEELWESEADDGV